MGLKGPCLMSMKGQKLEYSNIKGLKIASEAFLMRPKLHCF